jgi:alanyl-tRNA synthetase
LPDGRAAVILRETPFYAESGGQISDRGEIKGEGWSIDVDEVRKIDGRITALGKRTGTVQLGKARAVVPRDRRRDTERNHTATHLLHAALRQLLGTHVKQAGSVVEPPRLRFDFTHYSALDPAEIEAIERAMSRSSNVQRVRGSKEEAIASGGCTSSTKYGDVVRVVTIQVSMRLCGGTRT